jgi:hypothetical protein
MIRRDFIRTVALGAVLACASVLPAAAGTIYDSNVEQRLSGLSATQRTQVNAIVKKSSTDMLAVMRKYGIDPNAKPRFDLLQRAANELQAVERAERKAMQGVLDKQQLKQYDAIINETRIRVRKAAN